jgi:hypothetical protein
MTNLINEFNLLKSEQNEELYFMIACGMDYEDVTAEFPQYSNLINMIYGSLGETITEKRIEFIKAHNGDPLETEEDIFNNELSTEIETIIENVFLTLVINN